MDGISGVVTDTTLHSADVDYDNEEVTVSEMKNELDANHYYLAYVNLTASQAKDLIDTEPETVTVDVREENEYCGGHIPGAILSPWTSEVFQNEYLSILPQQGNIMLVCRSGNRSSLAGNFLYDHDFSRGGKVIIYSVKAGMNGWGYATETCSPAPVPAPVIQPWLQILLQE